MVDLEDQLRNGQSPFQSNPITGVQDVASRPDATTLFVVHRSPSELSSRSSLETQGDQIVFDTTDTSSETQSELYLSQNNEAVVQDADNYTSDANDETSSQQIPRSIKPQPVRLQFTLDVKPNQRCIYKSDQFGVREDQINGRIALVQGVKKPREKMLQILPKLRISQQYFQSNTILIVAVVLEKIDGNMRVWYKHPHRGFLPQGFHRDTEAVNSISFNLNDITFPENGDFPLSLPMITKWDKTKKDLVRFHQCSERETVSIHPAEHVEKAPRFICVIQQNGIIDWNTFCLSDFIRSPTSSKQRSSSTGSERASSSERKRPKVKH